MFEASSGRFLVRLWGNTNSLRPNPLRQDGRRLLFAFTPFWIRSRMAIPDLPYKETGPVPFLYVVLYDIKSTYNTPGQIGVLHEGQHFLDRIATRQYVRTGSPVKQYPIISPQKLPVNSRSSWYRKYNGSDHITQCAMMMQGITG